MYCIKCGVELADSEKSCPLCQTPVFHPELAQPEGHPLFPRESKNPKTASRMGWMFVLSMMFVLAIAIAFWTDLGVNGEIAWSHYVISSVLLFYTVFVLPFWFENAKAMIFAPIDLAATILYLLLLDLFTGGAWFLSFAFPVAGALGAWCIAILALLRYLRHGRLYAVGGGLIALGGLCVLVEFLLNVTFFPDSHLFWSFYPMVSTIVLGIVAIVAAANKPMREWLHKKLFF